jgi:hypothetical protein
MDKIEVKEKRKLIPILVRVTSEEFDQIRLRAYQTRESYSDLIRKHWTKIIGGK